MTKKSRLKIFTGFAIAVALLVLAAFTFTWESTTLTRAVLGALSGPDLKVEASSVRMNVLRGILLREVKVHAALEGGRLELTAGELRLSHRFWRLVAGEVAVDEIVLVKPEIAVVWDAPAPKGRPKSPAAPLLALSVRRLAIENGSFAMSEQGTPGEMVRFDGLGLELSDLSMAPGATSLLAGLEAQGTVEADRLAASGVVALGVTGRLELGESRLQVLDLALPVDFGDIVVPRLDLDLGRDPYFFSLAGAGDPLLTARLLGASSGFGNSRLEFSVEGDGSPRGGPRGQGALEVDAGTLGDMPLLAGLERLLSGTQLIGRPYSAFKVPFRLDDGDQVSISPFTVLAGNLQIHTAGNVDLTGPLDLHVEISLPRADVSVKEIPREVLEALTDVDGRVKLQIVVGGTIDQPAVRFDHRAWAGLAGRRLISEGLKRLFG